MLKYFFFLTINSPPPPSPPKKIPSIKKKELKSKWVGFFYSQVGGQEEENRGKKI
jgi:hypothetical protein